ncbi:D-alanine--D-alanine ligase [Reinekea sp.]|jgi:hypothetical protein|uniref:D-alanine--D-alanine ligase n=1 Tax=Reinekea sp. TaxID=1970455 RepID=UPI002A83FBD4|nr:D-alanine--D-alanine ligase [Reinekea sp.]
MSNPEIATPTPYVSPGMPPLRLGRTLSLFEFWPTWLMYIPVVVQWLVLAIRYRSLTLPLIANPRLPLSGMVGIPKSTLLEQAQGALDSSILDWFIATKTDAPIADQGAAIEAILAQIGLSFPIVCKPDIGCRGAGVKLVKNRSELDRVFATYPMGASMMVQKLADFEPEAGLFFIRMPGQTEGRIISLALKYMPYVIGDGQRTLAELIAADVRAGPLSHLYQSRHQAAWHSVVPDGHPVRLVFSASHSKGAIFKDAAELISPALTHKMTELMRDLPDFHYGRLDIKFRDSASLQRGEDLQIIEINTASSEPLHIWDSNTSLFSAMRSLLFQYRTLFVMGAANRRLGHQTPSLLSLYRHWRLEQELTRHYPETD